ncbi:MAG: hypothetical protein OXT09_34030 [Myxococcales bacterium]|nr:hypothetical protein [Myxococcales bacterium]
MSESPEPGRLVYTPKELLSDGEYAEPLYAGGVLCHGGFESDGAYRPPRTLHRTPAIAAWQGQIGAGGGELVTISDEQVPPQYPSVDQAKLLLKAGVREPIVRALTVISILEGFGAIIRDVRVPDLKELLLEPFDGTALAHLDKGLFEAHARDEAGYRDQGGHKQMWEAARDLALENPTVPSDVFMRLMGDRGRARGGGDPLFPQLDKKLYRMLMMMSQVLVIEVFARGTFEWGIDVLSDPEVSAEPEKAGTMVRYIQADESPHVEYLRTGLSEIRTRTLRTVDGKTIAGREVVDGILHHILHRMRESRPREQRDDTRNALIAAVDAGEAKKSLLEDFDAMAPEWDRPERTGFEPQAA